MMIKKIGLFICVLLCSSGLLGSLVTASEPNATTNFFNKLSEKSDTEAGVYNPGSFGISADQDLKENIRDIFYPGKIGANKLRPVLQTVAGVIFFIFIIVAGSVFLTDADDDGKISKAKNSLLYMMYGGFLVFGSMWLLSQLNVDGGQTGAGLITAMKDKVIFNFISFLKAGAFFIAILLIIYHGLQIIRAYEKEDKLNEGRKAIVNVLSILVLMKVIDYIYFIAYDTTGFKNKAVDLIIQVSKLLGWGIGALAVVYILYAGLMLVTGQGESDKLKKATTIIKGIFFAVLIIFLFLLTMYQIFKDLG